MSNGQINVYTSIRGKGSGRRGRKRERKREGKRERERSGARKSSILLATILQCVFYRGKSVIRGRMKKINGPQVHKFLLLR